MLTQIKNFPNLFLHPLETLKAYDREQLRPDLIAGLTVAVILLPQAIAYALIAELPPAIGLYTAVVAALAGALWGSSYQLHTGPTNAISLLIASVLISIAAPGTKEYLALAALMALMVGLVQLIMGVARLGFLVNFVSHSVIVGFSGGAGLLIGFKQLRHLLNLTYPSHDLFDIIQGVFSQIQDAHGPTVILGLGTIFMILFLRRLNPKLPGPLIAMIAAALAVAILGLDRQGVRVIGELPRSLPPVTNLRYSLNQISQLSTAALAVAAIGLVEAMSIARTIGSQTGQRLDSNQEFVGQGLANVACGVFSGYPCSGSFTRSAVNFKAGGQTQLASVFSGLFVLAATFLLGPFAAFVPRAALAGVLIVIAYGMIDQKEIRRIWNGSTGDALIMVVTFLATLFLEIDFAVLLGIILSFVIYIMRTSTPRVKAVLPDENYRHFTYQPLAPGCPQLEILDIQGDLYFGAVSHIEEAVREHMSEQHYKRFLLLRMHNVNQCDISGIHMLETIVDAERDSGGDVFFVRVRTQVLDVMKATGFYAQVGPDHFLSEDNAISHLFYRILDPTVCIYECQYRAFRECQNLPKQTEFLHIDLPAELPDDRIPEVTPAALWDQIRTTRPPMIIDVREPREFRRGHVPSARLVPLPKLLTDGPAIPRDRDVIFVCRGGRRSRRAAQFLQSAGYDNIAMLRGGMLDW